MSLQVQRRGPGMLRAFGVAVTDDGHVPDEARAGAPTLAHLVEIRLTPS